jgi:TatD DNase family protein
MFDSHCHVTDIEDPVSVLTVAKDAGVTGLLCCGYDGQSNAKVLLLRHSVRALPIALGIHPWFATESTDELLPLLERERPTAVGECGLEGASRDQLPSLDVQKRVFEEQLDAAARLGLPVTVHSRKAVGLVVEMALAFPTVRGVLHAYSGSLEQIATLLDRGWMVGVGGGVTRANASKLRRMVARLPLTALLLETDAPAIGLEGVEPPHVRPHHVVIVAESVAALRGMERDELVARTDDNARHLFGQNVDVFHATAT